MISAAPKTTEALRHWAAKAHFPTDLSSADLRGFSSGLRMRSVFAARMTNATAVSKLDALITQGVKGEINKAQFVREMLMELRRLGYDPATGFPQDMASIPPAERGSIEDLSSEVRLRLMWDTNIQLAFNYGRQQAGNSDYARYWYPAWELVRIFSRHIPRGSPESKSDGWDRRWTDAGESVEWAGVARGAGMVALKDSPIWQALGDGAGGYADTLGHSIPPFAFNSGLGWQPVDRARCVSLELIHGDECPETSGGGLGPDQAEIAANLGRLTERLRVHALVTQERETKRMQEDLASISERQAARDAFVESLTQGLEGVS
jgi:hypothetical protein